MILTFEKVKILLFLLFLGIFSYDMKGCEKEINVKYGKWK